MVLTFDGTTPQLDEDCWVAPTAVVAGDVVLGAGASVWFGAVVRGDVFPISIGAETNIQDNAVVHVSGGRHATQIGSGVTVGHGATLHGCTVHDRALIGIGAVVLDGAIVGEEAMVGAGALVTPGTEIPPRTLAVGSPARVKRPLTDAELERLRKSGPHYRQLAARYRSSSV